MKTIVALTLIAALSGCASIVSGTTQEVSITSTPPGANCNILREGRQLQQVTTPATQLLRRSKYDLSIACAKPGYRTATVVNEAGVNGWVFGNLVFGGLVGIITDVSTGAADSYSSESQVRLLPAPTPAMGSPVS